VIAALRSEWIKLHTVTMNWVLAIIAIAFPLLVVVLTTALIDIDEFDTRNLVELVSGTTVVSALLVGIIGTAGITSEFGFGTIRPTFASTPKRATVLAAKTLLSVIVALIAQAVIVVVSFGVGAVIFNSRSGDVSVPGAVDGRPALFGVIVLAGIVALLGFGLGALIRSTAVAVTVLILWPLVAENIVSALLSVAGVEAAAKYLPYSAGLNLILVNNVDSDSLSRVGGGLYFFAVTMVVVLLGSWITNRRDA
jgi:ABC-2 type transport system permease protein